MPIICNNCGQTLPDDSVFCPKCGTKVAVARCTGCGAVLAADARFCPSCGTPVESSPIPAEIETVAEQEVRTVEVRETAAEQVAQTAEVRETPVEQEIDVGAAQSLPDKTTLANVHSQVPRSFDWKYWSVSILRGYGTTKNAVEITDENVVINSKLNKRPIYNATTVPIKDIDSVEVWEKVSVITSLMVAVLVGLFIGLVTLSLFGATAIDLSAAEGIGSMVGIAILVAIVIYTGFFRMHHWRITIKTPKEPQYRIYELSAKPKDCEILFQLQKAIMDQVGMQGEPVRKKSNKLVPTFIVSIIVVLAIIAAMLLSRLEIFETGQADDMVDQNPIQTVENGPTTVSVDKPTSEPEDTTVINSPQYGDWVYDPAGLISAETADWLRAQNAMWSIEYQCVTAVAAITDALEYEAVDTYAYALADEWGLSGDDMLFLIYHNGELWQWYPNQTLYNYYEDGFGLQTAWASFQIGYEDGGIDNGLKEFFSELDSYYAEAYTAPAGDDVFTDDTLPIFESLELIYSSGVGAWATDLTLYRDGYFEGSYHDMNMGDTGDGYPNGTIYICNFSGQFSDITQVNDYTYSMTLENLYFYEEGIGGVWMIEDGIRYIVDYPYGVYGGMNFLFYSPDTPVNKLPVEFLDCWPGRFDGNPPDTLSCYGLYNEDEGIGFFTYE